MRKKIKNFWFYFVLLLAFFILTGHFIYVYKTYQFPKWDEYIFLDQAVAARDILLHPSTSIFSRLESIFVSRPPIYGISIALPLLIVSFHFAYKTALIINGIYYAATIISLYFLSKKFFSPFAGFLTAFIFAFYGFNLFYLHFAYSETATTTLIVLSLLFLSSIKSFNDKKNLILFSLFFGLGLLTRWVTPIFLAGPVMLVLVRLLLKSKIAKLNKNVFVNICLSLFFALGLPILIYYLPQFANFKTYVVNAQKYSPEWVSTLSYLSPNLKNTFSTTSVMFYFNIISQNTIYFFILFAAGLIISLIKFKKYLFLILAFAVPYLFFTFFTVFKDDRFIVPIYPSMALISAVFINELKYIKTKYFLAFIIITFGLLNFFGGYFGVGPLGHQGLKDIVLPSFIHHPRRIYLTTMVWPPRPDEIPARHIVNAVLRLNRTNHVPIILNTYTFNPLELDNALSSLQHYENKDMFIASNLRNINRGDYKELINRVVNSDFVLTKSEKKETDVKKFTGYDTDYMILIFDKLSASQNYSLPEQYKKITTFYYPLEKINLDLYQKIKEANISDFENWKEVLKELDPQYSKEISDF